MFSKVDFASFLLINKQPNKNRIFVGGFRCPLDLPVYYKLLQTTTLIYTVLVTLPVNSSRSLLLLTGDDALQSVTKLTRIETSKLLKIYLIDEYNANDVYSLLNVFRYSITRVLHPLYLQAGSQQPHRRPRVSSEVNSTPDVIRVGAR